MNKNIVVLFGGTSDERLVSVASAQAISQALGNVTLWFWHLDGSVYLVPLDELLAHEKPYTNEFKPSSKPLFSSIADAIHSPQSDNSVFLLAVHGGAGENGELQTMLESARRPFTGTGAKASHHAFDKVVTKSLLSDYPIKVAPHALVGTTNAREIESTLKDFFATHGDSIVKPVQGGSSIGCFFIRSHDDLSKATNQLSTFVPRPFLVEKMVMGRELTVGVIENNEGLIALPATEIVVDSHRAFDYEGKYLGAGTQEITPAAIDEGLLRDVQRIALAAHVALKLEGYSRADMIAAKDGVYFLETNTLPGLSKSSLVPQQLAVAGISMREFLTTQLKLALERV